MSKLRALFKVLCFSKNRRQHLFWNCWEEVFKIAYKDELKSLFETQKDFEKAAEDLMIETGAGDYLLSEIVRLQYARDFINGKD